MQAAAIAEEVQQHNPEHPGALHYAIHAYDDLHQLKFAPNRTPADQGLKMTIENQATGAASSRRNKTLL